MKHAHRLIALGLVGIAAVGMTAAGCATPWFGKSKASADPASTAPRPNEQEGAVAAYINGLCRLSKEERDPKVRELNEAVLPNHATISCGPGSGDGP